MTAEFMPHEGRMSGTGREARAVTQRSCTVADCASPLVARGFCRKHYARWQRNGSSELQPRPDELTRFMRHVEVGDCWLWTASKVAGGYGRFVRSTGEHILAHVYAYVTFIGEYDRTLDLDHFMCDTPSCVHPGHVRPVSHRENVLRGNSPMAWNLSKTECLRGHPFDDENTGYAAAGRYCRACSRDRSRRRAREATSA